jgi:hypothetical protein
MSGGTWVWQAGRWIPRPVVAPPPPRPVVAPPPPAPPPPPPPPPVVTAPPPPPVVAPPPRPPVVAPPPGAVVIRADDIRARRIKARVIYCDDIKAKAGRIGRIIEMDDRGWKGRDSRGKMFVRELVADTIYADDIKVDWVEADVIYADDAKIGRHGRSRDGRSW